MNDPLYIGIDNGVSGSIGFIFPDRSYKLLPTPTFSQLSYTKKKQNITRIDFFKLKEIFHDALLTWPSCPIIAVMERPMVNPGRFKATGSALRCLESFLICLEHYSRISLHYIDSKEWQKKLLPAGLQKQELKLASIDIAERYFPLIAKEIRKQKDGDAILMAEYARVSRL